MQESKIMKFLVLKCDVPTPARRIYPKAVIEEAVKRLKPAGDAGGLIGELGQPSDSIVHFKDASHKFTLSLEDDNLYAYVTILDTPKGKILQQMIDNKVNICFKARGVGNGRVNEDGHVVVGDTYKMITVDACDGDVLKKELEEYMNKLLGDKHNETGPYSISCKSK